MSNTRWRAVEVTNSFARAAERPGSNKLGTSTAAIALQVSDGDVGHGRTISKRNDVNRVLVVHVCSQSKRTPSTLNARSKVAAIKRFNAPTD